MLITCVMRHARTHKLQFSGLTVRSLHCSLDIVCESGLLLIEDGDMAKALIFIGENLNNS